MLPEKTVTSTSSIWKVILFALKRISKPQKIGNIVKTARIHDDKLHSFSVAKEHAFIVTCSKEGAKIIDPETLKVLKTFKTEVPMNTGCISPLAFDPKYPKYHAIIAGGVAAIDAAMSKVFLFEI